MERTVAEVMTKEVVTAPTESPVRDVAQQMARHRISCVVIVGGGKPIGILSERDIVQLVATKPNMLVGLTARECMSSPVVSLPASTTLSETLKLMKERGFRRFPIVDDADRLIGLVTQTDILHSLEH